MDFEAFEDVLARQRAVRAFDLSRPVDDAVIEQLLRAATRAPSGGNRQLWRFVIIRDAGIKARLSEIYQAQVVQYLGGPAQGQTLWSDVPVLIAVCAEKGGGGPSIFPAVQNLLLAASLLGLGGVLTTLWKAKEPEVKAALALPDEIEVHAILPIGWPDRAYGRSKRRPFAEVTYRDRYDQAW